MAEPLTAENAYGRVRWGLGEEPDDTGLGPPMQMSEMTWFLESRKRLNEYLNRVDDATLEWIVNTQGLPDGAVDFRLEPETLQAALQTAAGRLRRRWLIQSLNDFYEAAREAPGRYHRSPFTLDQKDALMGRDLLKRRMGTVVKITETAPGSWEYALELYVMKNRRGSESEKK